MAERIDVKQEDFDTYTEYCRAYSQAFTQYLMRLTVEQEFTPNKMIDNSNK